MLIKHKSSLIYIFNRPEQFTRTKQINMNLSDKREFVYNKNKSKMCLISADRLLPNESADS